jgi:hypothetical protein
MSDYRQQNRLVPKADPSLQREAETGQATF